MSSLKHCRVSTEIRYWSSHVLKNLFFVVEWRSTWDVELSRLLKFRAQPQCSTCCCRRRRHSCYRSYFAGCYGKLKKLKFKQRDY